MSNQRRIVSPPRIASEGQEQAAFIERCRLMEGRHPELHLIYAVPNGGTRNVVEIMSMKRQGLRPGVPDLVLPVARGGYHGWYGELKRIVGRQANGDELRKDMPSAEQYATIQALRDQGYWAGWHRGWEEAWADLEWYLSHGELSTRGFCDMRPIELSELSV